MTDIKKLFHGLKNAQREVENKLEVDNAGRLDSPVFDITKAGRKAEGRRRFDERFPHLLDRDSIY